MKHFSEVTQQRMLCFIRSIADDCKGCYRKSEFNCRICRSRWANEILSGIQFDREATILEKASKKKLSDRISDVLNCLRSSKRPLKATEIDIGTIRKEIKSYTLREMVSRGLILRKKSKNGRGYEYSLPEKGE